MNINILNNKINSNIFNKFFFMNRLPKFGKFSIYISKFEDNDIVFFCSFLEEILNIKPNLKQSGFVYDNTGSKLYNSFLFLDLNDLDIILNFIFYFYFLSKNLKIRKSFIKQIHSLGIKGIFSTFDISFYLFRDIFSFVTYTFIFDFSFINKIVLDSFSNILYSFFFFKLFGLF